MRAGTHVPGDRKRQLWRADPADPDDLHRAGTGKRGSWSPLFGKVTGWPSAAGPNIKAPLFSPTSLFRCGAPRCGPEQFSTSPRDLQVIEATATGWSTREAHGNSANLRNNRYRTTFPDLCARPFQPSLLKALKFGVFPIRSGGTNRHPNGTAFLKLRSEKVGEELDQVQLRNRPGS